MSKDPNQPLIDAVQAAYEKRDEESCVRHRPWREAVDTVFDKLDRGELRVVRPTAEGWQVEEWVKKAILLYFRFHPNRVMHTLPWGGEGDGESHSARWFDKVDLKNEGWRQEEWKKAGFRAVPGAIVRRSAHICPGAVLMPCFVNVGAYVGENSMIDSWATVGSCAQIGRDCHISGGAGIGGVLEPLQAAPVIIEDGCFVGARSEVAEGVVVETGAVISMGVYIGASTKIVDRQSGTIHYGRVPSYSVVVPGAMPAKGEGPSVYCAVIVKRVDGRTRSKTSINQLLRDFA